MLEMAWSLRESDRERESERDRDITQGNVYLANAKGKVRDITKVLRVRRFLWLAILTWTALVSPVRGDLMICTNGD